MSHIFLGVPHLAIGAFSGGTHVHTDIHNRLTQFSLFGGDDNHTVGSLCTINGSGRCVFQDVDLTNIIGVDFRHLPIEMHPIKNDQWLIMTSICIYGTLSSNLYGAATFCGSIVSNSHSRSAAKNILYGLRIFVGYAIGTNLNNRAGQVFLVHRTIAYDHHLVECPGIFCKHNGHCWTCHDHFLRDITDIAHLKGGSSGLLALIGYAIYFTLRNRIHLRNQLRYKEIAQEKAAELNHAKLQFFTNITHEFLTPLTIISATVDELQLSSPRRDNLYETLTRNINRLTRLLQQILEFRKAESGNLRLRVSYGNISRFVKISTDSFYPLIRKKKIHFSYVSDPDHIEGLFDTDKLDKILYNLISNAARYVEEGGAIQLTLSYLNEERDQLLLSVKDDGAGISKEEQQSLFQRFYEGDYRRHHTTGTGIGLSLVKDLVTLSHGTITVESDRGKGSEFSVILPIDLSYFDDSEIDSGTSGTMQAQPTAEPATLMVEKCNTKAVTKTTSILVVEDNEELLQLVHRLLDKEYHIHTAMNGKEALVVLEHEKIDLIVSDIMMPEMDGIELCKILKNTLDYSHIPIVILTAKTDEIDRADAYESGADAFISKPFNMNVLHARIKNLLKSRERVALDFKSQLVFEIKELHYTNMDEMFLKKAIDTVNQHLDDSVFDQQQFSEEMNVSKSTLYNKLKTLTGLNTSAFITNIRMKAACRIMDQHKSIRISELAYSVGFNDPKYFSSCFKKEFNMRPSEYMERFSGSLES